MRLLNSRLKLLMLTMIISLLSVVSAKAEWSNDPNINLAICTATGNQDYPKLISDGNGGVIIVWFDNRNGNYDIYAQKIDYSGKLLWPSQGVCICSAPDDQEWVEMISDGVGGAIVVWQDSRNGYSDKDIYAQRIDDSGNIIWPSDGVPICSAESHQEIPKLISDEVGGAIIVWEDYRNK